MSLEELRRNMRMEAIKETNRRFIKTIGIQPYYGIWVNYGDLDSNCIFESNIRKCRLIADVRQYVTDEELRQIERKYYPNFFRPKNFIKLMELPLANFHCETLAKWLTRGSYYFVDRFDFLESVIQRLQNDPYSDLIKEAIRKTNFEAEDLDEVVVDEPIV